jgi:hypothetical protein
LAGGWSGCAGKLANGLKVFSIAHPPYKEIELCEEDMDYLDKIWGIASEFTKNYDVWKTTLFADIQTADLEEEAVGDVITVSLRLGLHVFFSL